VRNLTNRRAEAFSRVGWEVLRRLSQALESGNPAGWQSEGAALKIVAQNFGQEELCRLSAKFESFDGSEDLRAAEETFEEICVQFVIAEGRLAAS